MMHHRPSSIQFLKPPFHPLKRRRHAAIIRQRQHRRRGGRGGREGGRRRGRCATQPNLKAVLVPRNHFHVFLQPFDVFRHVSEGEILPTEEEGGGQDGALAGVRTQELILAGEDVGANSAEMEGGGGKL